MEKKRNSKYYLIYLILIFSVLIIYGTKLYFVKICQGKYGIDFNDERKRLGISLIPANWHIKNSNNVSTWWIGSEDIIGHKWKIVTYNNCKIEAELDQYVLKPVNGKRRYIEIEHKYENKGQKAIAIYTLQIESQAKRINKDQADSLLAIK